MPDFASVVTLYRSMTHSSGLRPPTLYSLSFSGMPVIVRCSLYRMPTRWLRPALP